MTIPPLAGWGLTRIYSSTPCALAYDHMTQVSQKVTILSLTLVPSTLQKPVEEIQRLATFLEINREYEFLKAVAENCQFDVMKKRYTDTMEQMGAINFKAGAHFFRKGIFKW